MGSGWVEGEGEGGLRWATPVGAALTPFLINGAGFTNASVSCRDLVLKWWAGARAGVVTAPLLVLCQFSFVPSSKETQKAGQTSPLHTSRSTLRLLALEASPEGPTVQDKSYLGLGQRV